MKDAKVKKGYSNYTLNNPETDQTISLSCPTKLKMSFFQTMVNLRYGLPPLDVDPVDWKGLTRLGIPFLMVLICAALNDSLFYVILGLALLAYNIYITYRYYLDFVIQSLEQGYLPDENLKQVLEENGVMPLPATVDSQIILNQSLMNLSL